MIATLCRRYIVPPLRAVWTGIPTHRYWRRLEQSQFLPPEAMSRLQWVRLKGLLDYVATRNPYYRRTFDRLHLRPDDIRSIRDLALLPVLTKDDVRRNAFQMISEGFSLPKLLQFKTGGSTGTPLTIYIDETTSELRNASAWRTDRWAGWDLGEPVGAVWGNPVLPDTLPAKFRHWLLTPYLYLDTMRLTEDSVRIFAERWQRIRPSILFGHAHSLFLLARYVARLGLCSIQPKGIISSSMALLPQERQLIERTFSRRVFDRYGCEEVGLIGSECEKHDGLHLNSDHLVVEFLKEDGTPAQPGEFAHITVTDLLNRAMPLIRYRVEDIGVPSDRFCSCGRGLPLMEKVVGRRADFLTAPDGTKVAGISLIENTLTRLPGIAQMQIVQQSLDLIVLRLVPGPDFSAATEHALVKYFKSLFGMSAHIEISLVPEIPPEPSGTYRFAISHVDTGTAMLEPDTAGGLGSGS